MKHLPFTGGPVDLESDSLSIYLKEIRKEPVLTTDEELRLIEACRGGNPIALDKIVKANLRFVVSVATYYQHKGLSLSDLIAEGNLGLLKAVDYYDETKGFKFISYAVFWIRKSIMQAISQHSRTIRLPGHMVNSRRKIMRMFLQLEQQFGQEPTLEELAVFSDIEINELRKVLQSEAKLVSVDAPIVGDESQSLLDVIADTNAELPDRQVVHQESRLTEIELLLYGLNENQMAVVKMYYGMEGTEPMTLAEISIQMNVSKERIRQIKKTALKRMKATKCHQRIEDYLE